MESRIGKKARRAAVFGGVARGDGGAASVCVTVHEDFTEDLVNACVAGEVDLGLLALPVDDERVAVEEAASDAGRIDARKICSA